MHISEGAKKAGLFGKDYAAIISMPMVDEDSFIPELGDMRAALIDWKRTRGGSAKTVIMTLSGPSSCNEWAEAMLVTVFEDDPELNSIAKRCDVQVSVLNRGSTPSRQFKLLG
jgi:hypothetical protein